MLVLATLLILSIVYVSLNYYKTLCYWKDKGIRYITPLPIFGNSLLTFLQTTTYPEYVVGLYKQFPNERYCGTYQYNQPILLLRDLNLIKRIFTKEFDTFSEHPVAASSDEDILWGRNLFAVSGETWKQLRQIISPVFTSGSLRSMFGLMDRCARQVMDYLNEKDDKVIEIELRDLFKRYSSDTIASIAFGMDCNSFKDRNNDFMRMGEELTNFGGLKKLKRLLYTVNPKIAKLLNVKMHPDNVSNFFRKLVKDSLENRENEERPDYIQHLLESRKSHFREVRNKKITLELTDDDITVQALDFFYGGFYSTASLMYFCVYELAINPEIQDKLRQEIYEAVKHYGKITYDNLSKFKYLDMVISETLREWPTATWIDRKSNKSIVIEPEDDLEGPLRLETGTVCWIPVFAIQRDPKYWPDPEKFDPERFREGNRERIFGSSFLPFGAGPRNCIGSKFAIVEAKLIIFHIISTYEVVPIERSVLDRNPYLTSGDNFWFGFKRRRPAENWRN